MRLFIIGALILFFSFLSSDSRAEIYVFDGGKKPILTIKGNFIYKKGKVIGRVSGNSVWEKPSFIDNIDGTIGFLKTLMINESEKVTLIEYDDDVEPTYHLYCFFKSNCLLFTDDRDGVSYCFSDEFVFYRDKKILQIKGEYNKTELIAILYFLEKI